MFIFWKNWRQKRSLLPIFFVLFAIERWSSHVRRLSMSFTYVMAGFGYCRKLWYSLIHPLPNPSLSLIMFCENRMRFRSVKIFLFFIPSARISSTLMFMSIICEERICEKLKTLQRCQFFLTFPVQCNLDLVALNCSNFA